MLPQLVLKLVLPRVMDHIMKVFKLEKVLRYVEQPNELDIQMKDIEQKCTDIGFKVTAMQTVLKDLGEDQHPPAIDLKEWEDVKDTIKKMKNKKVFKSLGK
tara:strand:- start:1591 stop:1893 length:303 start_codon:yes stop_codon:yes gene_type:complete